MTRTRPTAVVALSAIAAALSLVLTSCTTSWTPSTTGVTHSGNCTISVQVVQNSDRRSYSVQEQASKSAGSSGVTCSVHGSVRFGDGTTFSLPSSTGYGRTVSVDKDAVLVEAHFYWSARYYGDVADSGSFNYG